MRLVMSTDARGTSDDDRFGLRSNAGVADLPDMGHAEIDEPRQLVSVEKKTIVIIGEQVLFRDCLAQCLTARNENCATQTFSSVAEWQKAARRRSDPSIIVLCSRNHATADIHAELSLLSRADVGVPMVLVSEVEDMEHALLALDHGARGYIPSSVTLDVAVEALHLVGVGGTFIPASCVRVARAASPKSEGAGRGDGTFTVREADVLTALRQGKANKQIAHDVNMSENTVKVHIRNIMKKLKARNRTEVVLLTQNMLGSV